ncbi:MAG: hypothetical protein A2666_01190 [Parcubacteria group bacterium RIFCSPHIGHO2_01_FULL_47_10b]|nr:MAG: hypothetical protein A2666_01190 [Parcubacteria group bacterium RIFCSPHIGHO2_01_FULL_47_10b]
MCIVVVIILGFVVSRRGTPQPIDIVPTDTSAVDTNIWQTYRNEEYAFEVWYPDDWLVDDRGDMFFIGPADFVQYKRTLLLSIVPANIGTESVFDLGAQPECSIDQIIFSGIQAKECTSDSNFGHWRNIKLSEPPVGWGSDNEIGYYVGSGYEEYALTYDQILSTFKFAD